MSATPNESPIDLKSAYAAVSATYLGTNLDIHEVCREQRLKSPVYQGDFITQFGVPTNAGIQQGTRPTFALFKYQDVMAVLRDGNTFTSGFIAEGLGAFFDGLVILAMDGEPHRKVRALLQPAFMPENVNKWRGQIDEVIRKGFLEPLIPEKKADLMQFGLELPIRIMYALMGFPSDDPSKYKQYAAWALAMVGGNQIDPEKMAEARQKAGIAVKGLYDAIQEVVVRPRSLLPAAGETTTRMFSSVMTLLLTTPGLLERVRADRSLIPKLMDETARFEPVATFKVRETAKDVEFHGVKIPKGSFVQCMVVSANRDEDAFENPEVFDIDRKLKPAFGFGFGPHMCIGQFIAKVEISCSINAILDLFPNLRLDPSQPAPVIEGAQLRGAASLPVIWD
ncbi:MAG: cytochrome [Pseudomonadales bacterium RIFCSPLOWO2_02_FULL_63_210]|nr:MAG: cytochrome [Pseudomonadales bacterium RIFCSPLOWO2_02_FULL_63_210]